MSEKIISVTKGEIKTKDDKDWVELTDQDGKVDRVFPSMLGNDGVWVHLDKEVDMLKAKIEDGTIVGLALKLTKERKGTYWNVIKVEEVKDVLVKKALEKVTDEEYTQTRSSIEAQVAFKGAVELMVAKVIDLNHTLATRAINWGLTKLKEIENAPISQNIPETQEDAPQEYIPDEELQFIPDEEVTAATVMKNFATIFNKKIWNIDITTKKLLALGAQRAEVKNMVAHLPYDKLVEFNEEIKKALKEVK